MNPETGKTPNKHTEYMGKMIRQARENLGMSQEELGEIIYRKRLAVSEMENGKVEISAWVLPLLANALKKPLSYFFPPFLITDIPVNSLDENEHELIKHFREIYDESLCNVAVSLVKVISEYDPEELIVNSIDLIADKLQREDETIEFLRNRKRNSKGN